MGREPPISLERMLELTAAAEVDGQKFEGVDYFHPHTDPDASDDDLKRIADRSAVTGSRSVHCCARLAGDRRGLGDG